MYCFFNKFFFKVEIFGNLPIFCHAHLVAIQDFVDREILFDRCGKCPMLCLFFDFKWTISAVKSTAHVMPCFMHQHSAFLCGGLAFAAINDKEIVKERDCEIVFEFNIHNVYVQSFQIIIHTANGCVHAQRDATLVQLINAASAWLETQLGRKLGKSTYRQRYCGTGTQQLSLEQYPIVSVERITDTFTGETITDFDFNETGEIGVLFREDGWTYRGHIGGLAYDYIAPRKYLEVQYVAGYILPKDATEDHPATLPADLEAIVWYMIAQQWAIIENDAAGLSAFSISDVSWTFDKNISETWQSVISKYQRW